MRVYLAGKITGDPEYRNKFAAEEVVLQAEGHHVMNPAILPDGFDYHHYLRICKAMLRGCDAVMFLPDWHQSQGARIEQTWAVKMGKKILYRLNGGIHHVATGD
jgi:hypothetical protein